MDTSLLPLAEVMSAFDNLTGVKNVVKTALITSRNIRIKILFDAVTHDLKVRQKLSQKTIESLFDNSREPAWREKVYSVATKAILANSTLAVKVMAIIAASSIASQKDFSEDEIRFLRALQDLADDEIIFCRRFWELYSQGKLETSHNEGESEEARKARDMQIIATEKNIYLLGTTNYFHKVEALKRFGIFGDVQHGLMGTTGGYGCALIIEQTGKFAEYVSLAEGLK